MYIFQEIVDFFGIARISEIVTFVDLLGYVIDVMLAFFIVCFVIRSICQVLTIPTKGFL